MKRLVLTSRCMRTLGFYTHQLCLMGLTKDQILDFPYTMTQWIDDLKIYPVHVRLLVLKAADFEPGGVLFGSRNPWDGFELGKRLKLDYDMMYELGLCDAGRQSHRRAMIQPNRDYRGYTSVSSGRGVPVYSDRRNNNDNRRGQGTVYLEGPHFSDRHPHNNHRRGRPPNRPPPRRNRSARHHLPRSYYQ